MKTFIHPTAEVDQGVKIGTGTKIWHQAQVAKGAVVGNNCRLGKGVYIGNKVSIGDNVSIQNYSCLYLGTKIGNSVFIGPHVVFATDLHPRSRVIMKKYRELSDWEHSRVTVREGASIGAGSVLLGKVTVGRFAMVGAGSLVNDSVCDYGLAVGCPARLVGFVCPCGHTAKTAKIGRLTVEMMCQKCRRKFKISAKDWHNLER